MHTFEDKGSMGLNFELKNIGIPINYFNSIEVFGRKMDALLIQTVLNTWVDQSPRYYSV